MEKDFDAWNEYKKRLEGEEKHLVVKEGEIWWSNIGLNIKSESCGKGENFRRPVLILKKLSHTNFIVIPLSTQLKTGTWFASYTFDNTTYTALLYQIKMMHMNRFTVNEGKIKSSDFQEIKKRLKMLLNL